jgi:hypothetical protein
MGEILRVWSEISGVRGEILGVWGEILGVRGEALVLEIRYW